MHGFPKISALLMVVGFVAAAGISRDMNSKRSAPAPDGYAITTEAKSESVYMPFFGMDKFRADVIWMMCINELGGKDTKMDDEKAVKYFYKQFDHMTELDPDFEGVYNDRVSHIAYYRNAAGEPEGLEMALHLIDRGEERATKLSYMPCYYAANLIMNVLVMPEKDVEKKKEYMKRAVEYLSRSLAKGDAPWYVENSLLHTIAKIDDKYDKPIPELTSNYNYFMKKLETLKAQQQQASNPSSGASGMTASEMADQDPFSSALQDSFMEKLRDRIMKDCRSNMLRLLAEEKKQADKGKLRENLSDQATLRRIYAGMRPEEKYSPRSLVAYDPGDLFDSVTGDPLPPYGIDLYDYEVNDRITLVKGAFNTLTGKPTATTFEELKRLMGDKPIVKLKDHMPRGR